MWQNLEKYFYTKKEQRTTSRLWLQRQNKWTSDKIGATLACSMLCQLLASCANGELLTSVSSNVSDIYVKPKHVRVAGKTSRISGSMSRQQTWVFRLGWNGRKGRIDFWLIFAVCCLGPCSQTGSSFWGVPFLQTYFDQMVSVFSFICKTNWTDLFFRETQKQPRPQNRLIRGWSLDKTSTPTSTVATRVGRPTSCHKVNGAMVAAVTVNPRP